MTDAELRQLALDTVDGKVCGSWQFAEIDVPTVFPILMLMDEPTLDRVKRDYVHVYEYRDKAGPWAVNGMPQFFSARMLTAAEWDTMSGYARELLAQREAFLKGDP